MSGSLAAQRPERVDKRPSAVSKHEPPFHSTKEPFMDATNTVWRVTPWNKGKLLGQKPPLKLKEIWAIRIRLQLDHRARELALFNLALGQKRVVSPRWARFRQRFLLPSVTTV